MLRARRLRQKTWASAYGLLCVFALSVSQFTSEATAQDGASYNPRAKAYRAPALSIVGAKDTPERTAALGLLWQGKIEQSLYALAKLGENGDVPSAVLLGDAYSHQSQLHIPLDPAKALHFFRIASSRGSGEASERIAEMIDNKEITGQPEGDAAFWRNLARNQGWVEEHLATYCFDWIHGLRPLRCEAVNFSPPLQGNQDQCPNEEEMTLLRQQGLTGVIRVAGGGLRDEHGPQARAILIVDHSVPTEQDLREPDSASVIYIQTPQNHWRMLPSTAPLLDRFIILTPGGAGEGRMSIAVQDVDGSTTGGACGK